MPNPFRSFQYLPWTALLLSAGLTVLVATALDILVGVTISVVPMVRELLLGIEIISLLASIAAPFGIGALAIFLTLQFFPQILLRTNTIWALIGCVLLFLLVKSWLPIPALFVGEFSFIIVMMVTVGSFTASRRYWR